MHADNIPERVNSQHCREFCWAQMHACLQAQKQLQGSRPCTVFQGTDVCGIHTLDLYLTEPLHGKGVLTIHREMRQGFVGYAQALVRYAGLPETCAELEEDLTGLLEALSRIFDPATHFHQHNKNQDPGGVRVRSPGKLPFHIIQPFDVPVPAVRNAYISGRRKGCHTPGFLLVVPEASLPVSNFQARMLDLFGQPVEHWEQSPDLWDCPDAVPSPRDLYMTLSKSAVLAVGKQGQCALSERWAVVLHCGAIEIIPGKFYAGIAGGICAAAAVAGRESGGC